jgi:hypothetical protein
MFQLHDQSKDAIAWDMHYCHRQVPSNSSTAKNKRGYKFKKKKKKKLLGQKSGRRASFLAEKKDILKEFGSQC